MSNHITFEGHGCAAEGHDSSMGNLCGLPARKVQICAVILDLHTDWMEGAFVEVCD